MFEKLPVHQVSRAFPAPCAGEDADTLEFAVKFANEPLDGIAGLEPPPQVSRRFIKEQHPVNVSYEMCHGERLSFMPSPFPSFESRQGFGAGSGFEDAPGLTLNQTFA